MNARWALPICLLISSGGVAQRGAAALESQAAQAHGGECIRLNLQAANAHVDSASHSYDKSDMNAAHGAVNAIAVDVERSVDCALKSPHAQKSAEIELRRLSRRMTTLLHSLEVDERPYVEQAQAAVEKQHDRLLHAIFGDAAVRAEKNP
jgi:hypothetical protein